MTVGTVPSGSHVAPRFAFALHSSTPKVRDDTRFRQRPGVKGVGVGLSRPHALGWTSRPEGMGPGVRVLIEVERDEWRSVYTGVGFGLEGVERGEGRRRWGLRLLPSRKDELREVEEERGGRGPSGGFELEQRSGYRFPLN